VSEHCQTVLSSAASALVAEGPQTIRVLGDCYSVLATPTVEALRNQLPFVTTIEAQHCCCSVRPAGERAFAMY